MRKAARIGYAAKGVTYILIAVLAIQAALSGRSAEGTRGALQSLEGPTGGEVLLLAIGIGLGSYALWKLYIALADPENDGLGKRVNALTVAFVNAGFALEAVRLSLWNTGSGRGDQAQHWSTVVMSHKAGVIAVGIAGLSAAGYGIGQFVRAVRRRKIEDRLHGLHMAPDTKSWVVMACRFGIAARGVVFVLVGWFLVRAALQSDPSEAKDFGHSLNELRAQPMGRTLLFVVASGLLLYALYQFLRARYERFAT